jgi:DNA-binding CsgD family transcriptional regulator/sugar-specific transcriptional regulator TrmB
VLYAELRRRGASDFDEVVAELGLNMEEQGQCRRELLDLGLIVPTGTKHDSRLALAAGQPPESESGTVAAVSPEMALIKLLEGERGRLREDLRRAEEVNSRLESLATRFLRSEVLAPSAEVEVEVITDYRRIQQVMEDITDTVEREHAGLQPMVGAGREIPERSLARDRRQIAKGVHVRVVINASALNTPQGAENTARKAAAGVNVRVAGDIPMNMIIADRQVAMLPLDPEHHEDGAILARGPALVRSYCAFFEQIWRNATPYGEQREGERDSSGLTEQQRAALLMLASGMKDEKIARGLGVSLRTVSRILSELMQELGASSRFEAGVRAARLGWLD